MRVLVLGTTGMLGHMVCRVLGPRHEVTGTVRTALPTDDPVTRFIDHDRIVPGVRADDVATVTAALDQVSPDAVVNCIGIVKQLAAAQDAIASIETNSLFPHLVAQACNEASIRFVHVSTDCVFSGRKGNYDITDIPDPVDLYGRSKLLGETTEGEALTIRTSIVGRQLHGTTSLFEWVIANRGRTIGGFDKAIYSGLTTMALARVIDAVLTGHAELSGVWQVASEPITKFDLLNRLNRELALDLTIERNESFTCDRSLDGSAFEAATGIVVPSWDNMLSEFAADQGSYALEGSSS